MIGLPIDDDKLSAFQRRSHDFRACEMIYGKASTSHNRSGLGDCGMGRFIAWEASSLDVVPGIGSSGRWPAVTASTNHRIRHPAISLRGVDADIIADSTSPETDVINLGAAKFSQSQKCLFI